MSLSSKKNQEKRGSSAITSGGFTLIELLVSVSIFVFMTTFLVFKYGNFNQTVLVINAAYDIALTIRSTQSYGLNVKQSIVTPSPTLQESFQKPFGVHFTKGDSTFFTFNELSIPPDYIVTSGVTEDPILNTSTIKKGIVVSDIQAICADGIQSSYNSVDISFKRPDPDAIIRINQDKTSKCQFVKIIVKAPDGSAKSIVVRGTGQIAIED